MTQSEAVPINQGVQPQAESSATVWPPDIYPYHAGVIGGFYGGVAMAIVGTIAGLVIGRGPWYPVNLLAAAAVPSFQAMNPEELAVFSLEGLFVGTILPLSIIAHLVYTIFLSLWVNRYEKIPIY